MTAPVTVRTKFWPAYLMARVWMRDDAYGEAGDRLAELLMANAQDAQQRPLLSHLMRDRAVYRVRRSGGNLVAGADPGLSLWHPGGYYFASGSQAGVWPAWWVERDGLIVHVSGPEVSPLYFDYPLSGSFEFSVDGYWDPARSLPFNSGDSCLSLAAAGTRHWFCRLAIRNRSNDLHPRAFNAASSD